MGWLADSTNHAGATLLATLRHYKSRRKKARKIRKATAAFPVPSDIERQIISVLSEIDFYWTEPTKQAFLAHVIVENDLKLAVEIGVHSGGSLVPQIIAVKSTGGIAIGIDPYSDDAAMQKDNREILDQVNPALLSPDRDGMYKTLLALLDRHDLSDHCKILRMTSNDAAPMVEGDIDLLHIDGNHDFDRVMDDLRNYVPKLRIGGFLVMDDIDWPAIAPLYEQVKRQMTCVYEASSWGCCRKTGSEIEFHDPRGTVGE